MKNYPADIYTEAELNPDTLSNLGPLAGMAGIWSGAEGVDVHPARHGAETQQYVERIELQPIDPQTNGPQLFYGLRYHVHVVRPGEAETFHDQIGYWLWEPATGNLIQTVSIPRGQTAMAFGHAAADARSFTLVAKRGSPTNGIISNPFLDEAFRTESYTIKVEIHDDGTWSYEENTVLMVRGQSEPFEHTDRNRLRRIAAPTPNPTAHSS
jgi:hypothetical protein